MHSNDTDWDDAFSNGAYIPGSEALPDQWAQEAATYRASGIKIDVDIAYADHPRARFDLIWPDATPKGLAVFIHGGYWLAFDKSSFTHFAEGARANGWAVCVPSYTLAPEFRIAQMTQQIAAAVTKAAALVPGPIAISGHSAGGHLAARMVCGDAKLAYTLRTQAAHILCISGVHDLRPLMQTKMNDTLQIDENEATRESPALLRPDTPNRVTAWVGGAERPEFIRQSKLLVQNWEGSGTPVSCVVDRDHNHFSVIDGLRDPRSEITQAFIGTV